MARAARFGEVSNQQHRAGVIPGEGRQRSQCPPDRSVAANIHLRAEKGQHRIDHHQAGLDLGHQRVQGLHVRGKRQGGGRGRLLTVQDEDARQVGP